MTSVDQILLDHLARVEPSELVGLEGVAVLLDLFGEGGGKWTLYAENGQAMLEEGETRSISATMSMTADDFIAIASGTLNPIAAFMQGRVKVSGDMRLVTQMQGIFAP
ncbi:MAG: SCP2 sterol-binding domain-containing protein [Anaerolineae bacterium]|nr:SCP2 sterol-binding domain-containing protein [Anaerolineae bacterium]